MSVRHGVYAGGAVGTALLWVTHNFGVSVWILLFALAFRFILYLVGVREERNPFVSGLVYLGTVGISHFSLPLLVGPGSLTPIIQAIVIAATLYELKHIILELPLLPKVLHITQSDVARLQSDVKNLEAMVENLAAQNTIASSAVNDTQTGGMAG